MSPLLRRIIEIERLIEQAAAIETFERPAHEMTDPEAVEEWRRLCHLHPPGMVLPKLDPEEQAAIMRRLTG